jgi:hypothetical protein
MPAPAPAPVGASSSRPVSASRAPAGFLFATFKGEQTPLSEQVCFALSTDGRAWSALNGGEPVLVNHLGERGLRDPFVLRAPEGGNYYLIGTDLSIHLNPDWTRAVRAGSRCIVVWESPDLVHWSAPRLAPVAPADAGCTWAPEAIYDTEKGDFLVFWASTTARDDFAKHRIWAARTRDFRAFSAPFVYIDREATIIDTTIVHDGRAYHRFTKDEKYKSIMLETAEKLDGEWREIESFSLRGLIGHEGPACYLIEPAAEERPPLWGLILDHYMAQRGYQPFVTQDIASGRFEPASDFSFPFPFRHGSVLPLDADEVARLRAAYGV